MKNFKASARFGFTLYVISGQAGSLQAEPDLRAALDASLAGRYELEVVDLRMRPECAERDKVLAAPTVIRFSPRPARRAIGNLSDAVALCMALELPLPRNGG